MTLIPSPWRSKVFWVKPFVKGSARLSSDAIWLTTMPPLPTLSDGLILPLYVLSSLMAHRFLRICNRSAIITIKYNSRRRWRYHSQIHQKILEPYHLLCCFWSCNVLGLYGGVSNARLLNTPPTDGSTSKGEHISEGRLWLKIRVSVPNGH